MTTLLKKDLSDAVDALGWESALRHLADMAREQAETGLAGTLRVLADVMGGDTDVCLADDPLGLLLDDADCQYPVQPGSRLPCG